MNKLSFILLFLSASAIASPQRVAFYTSEKLTNQSKKLAFADLGKVEKNGNRGDHIKKYGQSVYGKPIDGFYYCYAFQYWAVDSASKLLKIANPLPRTGHCNTAFNECLKRGKVVKFEYKVDDIGIYRASNGSGHAFRIAEIINKSDGVVKTIEANTSPDVRGDQRNGGGVYLKKRFLRHPLGRMNFRGAVGLNG